jgi:hypothetical protein
MVDTAAASSSLIASKVHPSTRRQLTHGMNKPTHTAGWQLKARQQCAPALYEFELKVVVCLAGHQQLHQRLTLVQHLRSAQTHGTTDG